MYNLYFDNVFYLYFDHVFYLYFDNVFYLCSLGKVWDKEILDNKQINDT